MVSGIIKLLTSDPVKIRPALQTLRIRSDGKYGYITNGYICIRYKMEIEPKPNDGSPEFIIPVENLIKWYKLANTKDYLDETSILSLQDKENDTVYPEIEKIFDAHKIPERKDNFKIDSKLIECFAKCAGSTNIKITPLIGSAIHVQSIDNRNIDGVIMELR